MALDLRSMGGVTPQDIGSVTGRRGLAGFADQLSGLMPSRETTQQLSDVGRGLAGLGQLYGAYTGAQQAQEMMRQNRDYQNRLLQMAEQDRSRAITREEAAENAIQEGFSSALANQEERRRQRGLAAPTV